MEEWAAENPAVAALCADDIHAHRQVDNSIEEAKGTLYGAGLVAFGAGMWTAPVATLAEAGFAYAMDKTAEHVALAAGASPETASTIGTATGFVTPFATMGKVGALADATITPALKTGAQKVTNLASRIEVKSQPGVASCNGFGGVNVSLKSQVDVPTTAPAAPKLAEATVSEAPLSLPKYESGRYVPGQAIMSFELTNPPVLLRGSHNNVAKVPLEVAQKMSGKEFKTFDEFRSEFWKTMAESSYAKEFSTVDIYRMRSGCAPRAHDTQWLGERKAYELHHIVPIHEGGAVYDLSNILVTTPKYHLEILPKAKHFGVKK